MTEGQDLRHTLREIEKYLKEEGFVTFYGIEQVAEEHVPGVRWAERKSGWKSFLKAAKEAGVKVVVLQSFALEREGFQEIQITFHSQRERRTDIDPMDRLEKLCRRVHRMSQSDWQPESRRSRS